MISLWLATVATMLLAHVLVERLRWRPRPCDKRFTPGEIGALLVLLKALELDPDELLATGTDDDVERTNTIRELVWRINALDEGDSIAIGLGRTKLA